MNLAYGQGELKLEINIPPQHILAKRKGAYNLRGRKFGVRYYPFVRDKYKSNLYPPVFIPL